MFPASGFEGLLALWREKGDLGPATVGTEDAADAGDGDSGNRLWDAGGFACSEEQLVVFAAVKRLGQVGAGVDGKQGGIDFGGDGGLGAEVG